MRRTVLMTGARGFIGRRLKAHLESHGFEILSLVRMGAEPFSQNEIPVDLKDLFSLKNALDKIKFDFVLHLASDVRPGRGTVDLDKTFSDHVLLCENLAQSLPPTTRLALFFGSCEEYGNGVAPFVESQKPECFSAYGWGKIASYFATQLIASERGLRWAWLRPFLTFGPGQSGELLIPSLIRKCQAGEAIAMTKGEQTRDFIYIEDLCAMVCQILQNHERLESGEILNLCSGQERSILSVAQEVQKIIGRGELQIGKVPYRSREAMRFYGSRTKWEKYFGKTALTPFDEALRETILARSGET